MKKNIILFLFCCLFCFSFISMANAQEYRCNQIIYKSKAECETANSNGCCTPINISTSASSQQLPNPLGTESVEEVIGRVIKAILGVVGSLALLMFIYGGLTWMTAAGNKEKVEKGKEIIIWAALGLVVIFASYALVEFVLNALTSSS